MITRTPVLRSWPPSIVHPAPTPQRVARRREGTSHVERKNGTLRQWCERLTSVTYAFSEKWDNLKAALAMHFAHYNFCRIHGSLRITPAMAAGISDHVWTWEERVSG